ncbi:hypothetical protein SELMODRAFT_403195 [Selaginella moellendorffii]|uniref:Uncharacterized protein n=1 Tax=Selaginella moellendorffii TaxID=88036 RepID=D8QTD7_SELML|nr:hypothetical protein SELMODRAFT_403195 [Selaginella moellendorffii]
MWLVIPDTLDEGDRQVVKPESLREKFYYIVMKKTKKEKQRQELAAGFGLQREERSENSGKRRTDADLSYSEETPKPCAFRNPGVDNEDNHLWTIRSHGKEIRAALSATSEAAGSRGTNVKSQAYEEMSMQSCKGSSTLKLGVHRLSVATLYEIHQLLSASTLWGLVLTKTTWLALWQQVVVKAIDNCFCRGMLVPELISQNREDLPPMDALEFNNNLLICGSYSSQNGSGIVQIWDVDALLECCRFPANDMSITDAAGTVVVTGDGTVGLFDIRSYGASWPPLRVPVEDISPVVRDTRLMPMETRDRGFVGAGDQGGNYALWFSSEWRNGSVALWDVTLGEPCPVSISSDGCWYFLFKFCFFV